MGSESVVRLLSLFNGNLGSVGEVSYQREVIMRLPTVVSVHDASGTLP